MIKISTTGRTLRHSLVLGGLLLALAACGSQSHGTGHTGAGSDSAAHGSGAQGAMTDVQFIDGMIVHHQGAITMATQATTQSSRPEVQQLAAAIVKAQDPEIKQLQGWRQQWYPNAAPSDPKMMESMHMGQMEIANDPGKEFDQRFLEAMISHHQGAVQMAEGIKGSTTHAELRSFAEKVIADQNAEIQQMQSWLKTWYAQ